MLRIIRPIVFPDRTSKMYQSPSHCSCSGTGMFALTVVSRQAYATKALALGKRMISPTSPMIAVGGTGSIRGIVSRIWRYGTLMAGLNSFISWSIASSTTEICFLMNPILFTNKCNSSVKPSKANRMPMECLFRKTEYHHSSLARMGEASL